VVMPPPPPPLPAPLLIVIWLFNFPAFDLSQTWNFDFLK
jgi:hypothetical protein